MAERLLQPKELAERLGTSRDRVYRHWKAFPFTFTVKLSPRQHRFSGTGLPHDLARPQHEGSPLSHVPGYDGHGLGKHAREAVRSIPTTSHGSAGGCRDPGSMPRPEGREAGDRC
jgi:hypothetical protein